MSQSTIEPKFEEREEEALSVVGTRQPRHDAWQKVSGASVFGTDFSLPGMLRGKIFRSPYPHAMIRTLDTSKAEALPGVRAVITHADFQDRRFGPAVKDQTVLAVDKVYFQGQPVCAVAADTIEIAENALALIDVDFDPLPNIGSAEQAMEDASEPVHPESKPVVPVPYKSRNVNSRTLITRGDVEKGFRESDFILEETYSTQRVHQGYIEPKAATAAFDRATGRVTVWAATQASFFLRASIADMLDMPVSSIQVITTQAGGGFGGKAMGEFEAICIALARKAGRPVKIVLTRAEELIAGTPRPEMHFTIRSGVKQGRIVARKARAVVDGGGFAMEAPMYAGIACMQLLGVYDIPNFELEGVSTYTNKQPAGSYRAPGTAETNFAVESHTDMLAKRAGKDPLAFRLANCWTEGSLGPTGQVMESVGVKEVLRRTAGSIGWAKRDSFGEGVQGSKKYGIGLACAYIPTVSALGSSAFVRLNEDGRVTVITGAQDTGAGSLTALMMIAAEELGIGLDRMQVQNGDSDLTPWDGGAQGSRTTAAAGNAVMRAAVEVKRQLVELAASQMKADPGNIKLEDGSARTSTGESITLAELAKMALSSKGGPIVGSGSYAMEYPDHDKDSIKGFVAFPSIQDAAFVAHAAVVSVDVSTGKVSVERYAASHDVGKAINPLGVEGQMHGGAVQGIGYALYEQIRRDESGLVLNPDFGGYKLPTIADVPEIEAEIVEGYLGKGPYGAKAVGEGNIVPPSGAIANAVFDAVGARIRNLPMSPEAVLNGMELTTHP